MRPNPVSTSVQLPIPLTITEDCRMPMTLNRVLDAGASIAIVLLATLAATATAFLGV